MRVDYEIQTHFVGISLDRFIRQQFKNFTQREVVIVDLLELNTIQLGKNPLPTRTGIDEIGVGVRIRNWQKITFGGFVPHLRDFNNLLSFQKLMISRFTTI